MLEEFKKYFEEFSKRQTVIAGAPSVVFLTGEHEVLNGALAVCMQTEQRVWVGLQYLGDAGYRDKERVVIPKGGQSHLVWLTHPGLKEPIPIKRFRPPVGGTEWPKITEPLELYLNGLLNRPTCKDLLNLDDATFELSILSEVRSGSGCNFSGAFSVATITAIHLASVWLGHMDNTITKFDISSSATGEIHKLLEKPNKHTLIETGSTLDLLNRAALALECWFHGGRASGYGTICSLVPTRWPITYLRETPTNQREPRLPIKWEEIKETSRDLTEDEWRVIDKYILDPQSGLRYAVGLFEQDASLVSNVNADLPFSYGTIYSGNPKDTARQIKKVEVLKNEVIKNIEKDLYFFLNEELTIEYFKGVRAPTFFDILKDLQSEDQVQTARISGGGIHWAGMLVVRTLCELLRKSRDKDIEDRNVKIALVNFADAITAAQGGLSQLFLVDPVARRIEGCILQAHKEWEDQIGIKYTGGARGGNLICIGPAKMDPSRLRTCLEKIKSHDDTTPLWDRPMVDYWSTDYLPRGEGGTQFCCVRNILPKRPLYHFIIDNKGCWTQKFCKQARESYVHRLRREDIPCRCIIYLDRDPKHARCRLFLGNREIEKIAWKSGRGKPLFPHLLFALLKNKGMLTNKKAIRDAKKLGLDTKTYLGTIEGFDRYICKPLKLKDIWNQSFHLKWEIIDKDDSASFKIILEPHNKGTGEFYIYVQD